jgi:hypothetical protein
MARELERAVVGLVQEVLGADLAETPEWLVRPGRTECGNQWSLIQALYADLTGLELPEVMRPIERRAVDALLLEPGRPPRILEVDEKQHFVDVLELVERDEGPVASALLEPKRQIEQRMQRRQWIGFRVELQPGADAVGTEREADARLLEEILDLRASASSCEDGRLEDYRKVVRETTVVRSSPVSTLEGGDCNAAFFASRGTEAKE